MNWTILLGIIAPSSWPESENHLDVTIQSAEVSIDANNIFREVVIAIYIKK